MSFSTNKIIYPRQAHTWFWILHKFSLIKFLLVLFQGHIFHLQFRQLPFLYQQTYFQSTGEILRQKTWKIHKRISVMKAPNEESNSIKIYLPKRNINRTILELVETWWHSRRVWSSLFRIRRWWGCHILTYLHDWCPNWTSIGIGGFLFQFGKVIL